MHELWKYTHFFIKENEIGGPDVRSRDRTETEKAGRKQRRRVMLTAPYLRRVKKAATAFLTKLPTASLST